MLHYRNILVYNTACNYGEKLNRLSVRKCKQPDTIKIIRKLNQRYYKISLMCNVYVFVSVIKKSEIIFRLLYQVIVSKTLHVNVSSVYLKRFNVCVNVFSSLVQCHFMNKSRMLLIFNVKLNDHAIIIINSMHCLWSSCENILRIKNINKTLKTCIAKGITSLCCNFSISIPYCSSWTGSIFLFIMNALIIPTTSDSRITVSL